MNNDNLLSTHVSDKVKKCKVSIFGETYWLITDESEQQITAAANLVDTWMRDIAQSSQISDSKRIAVLVALQLASKTLAAQDALDKHQQHDRKLIDFIDREIAHFQNL